MGLFHGASKEEKQQEKDTWSNLSSIGNTSLASAKTLGQEGQSDTGAASSFFKGVLSGDRTAVAPGVNAAVEGADAAKREQAQMGTARGGGASSGNQQVEQHTQALISSLIGEAQTGAADKLAAIGSGDTNAMMNSLGISSGTNSNLAATLHQDIADKSPAKMWGSLIGGAVQLGTAALTGGMSSIKKVAAPLAQGNSNGVPWQVPG